MDLLSKARMLRVVRPRDLIRPKRLRLIRAVSAHTLLPHQRLSHLADLASDLPAGAIAECGSYLGGSAAVLASIAPTRTVWLFDSWEGCPPPTTMDVTEWGRPGVEGEFAAAYEDARRFLYTDCHFDPERVRMVRGWFEHTLPLHAPEVGPIALLHLDGDWYESTRTALESLYSQVVPGGLVVIDDYGDWAGCRKAVDEYLPTIGLDTSVLQQREAAQAFWVKP